LPDSQPAKSQHTGVKKPHRKLTAVLAASLTLVLAGLVSGCTTTEQVTSMTSENAEALVLQRADPWVHRHTDGSYFFIATAPEFDRIEMRRSDTIAGIRDAAPKVVWQKKDSGPMSEHIWAPELHHIDGVWYIHFAASAVEDPWRIRMYVLENRNENPMEGDWAELGQITTQHDSFALDATHFEHNGERYLIWAQSDIGNSYNSALWISKMRSPTQLTGRSTIMTQPQLDWETVGYKVNEGAAVLIANGKIFVTYSASATDHNYAMGLLVADEDSDLTDPKSWTKSPTPVFYTNERLNRFGPGHNSFVLAEDGETWLMVYHARDYKELDGNSLTDPNRHTYVRKLLWTTNGYPDFAQELSDAETFSR
jgi:GH43 family beta-xylosidase